MKNKILGGILLVAAGFVAGNVVQARYDQKSIDRWQKNYNEELERANRLVDRVNQLDLDLRQCRLTNWQVAQYAAQLKRAYDNLMG